MTAEQGRQAHEPTGPSDSASAGDAAPLTGPPLRMLVDEPFFWRILDAKDTELRRLLESPGLTGSEQTLVRADLESLVWLSKNWGDLQHQARALKDFAHWLQTPPSRLTLFQNYCRHAVPVEWDRYAATQEPPYIFERRERLVAHLEHCQLCGLQRQLGEVRRCRASQESSTWGERLAHDFAAMFCRDALAAVCDPQPYPSESCTLKPQWSPSPPCRLFGPEVVVLPQRSEHPLQLRLRLVAPAQSGPYEIRFAVQSISGRNRKPSSLTDVFPSPRSERLTQWRPGPHGGREISLVAPSPGEPGRLVLRYWVRGASSGPAGQASDGGRSSLSPTAYVNALTIDLVAAR